MSELLEGPIYGKVAITGDENNNRTYTMPFSLQCDQPTSTQTALTYLDYEYGDYYESVPDGGTDIEGYEFNEGCFITGFSIDPRGDTGWYDGTITFTTQNRGFSYQVESLASWDKPEEPKNSSTEPEERNPTITRSVEYEDVAWTHDAVSGAPLQNSSLQPYVGETRRIKIDVYTLTWFETTNYYFNHYREYENCINSSSWNDFLTHGLLFDSFTYQSQHSNGKFVWACSAVFKEKRNWEYINGAWIIPGWKQYIVDKGTRFRNYGVGMGGRFEPIKNIFGELEEKLLAGNAFPLGEGLNPVFLPFQKYRLKDFAGIFA